ncbi:hypothetical protein B0H11DRAFT_2362278 [Mycena galericulata]|nr:hypothetical protein B0H11DRAFT_2362278 [Mycena galericulata]
MPADRSPHLPYSPRFTPLLRRATPKTPHYQAALQSLVQWNSIEIPATWCALSNDWVPWTMPMRVLKRQKKLVRIAASGYYKIKNLQPPRCPHLYQDARLSDMKLHLNKTFDNTGQRANFFRADSHPCQYYVFIPDIPEYQSEYITTPEEREVFEQLVAFEEEEPELSAGSSQSSSLSTSSTSTADTREVEEYLLHGNPRIPRPSDLPPALLGPLKPFFNGRVSDARKTVDLLLMDDTQQFADRGYYTDNPERHPVAEVPVHVLMEIYDHKAHPTCLTRAFSNLEHIDTHLGRAIREFHSCIGIPPETWQAIVNYRTACKCCQCVFSVDGYNSHVVDGRCSMAPPLEKVPIKEITPPYFSVRTYPNGYKIPVLEDFLETPSGVAFTEWNSRIGVPMDVWILLSTSGVKCKTCHLRRSFKAHQAHCDETGQCLDPGEIGGTLAV